MAVAGPEDSSFPLERRLSDPLSEFAIESLDRVEPPPVVIESAPSIAAAAISDVAADARRQHVSRTRWSIGAALLAVGLTAGFVGGVAVSTRDSGDDVASEVVTERDRTTVTQPRAEVATAGSPVPEPVSQIPAIEPGPAALSPAVPQAEPRQPLRSTSPPASPPVVQTRTESSLGALYVQSRPSGAQVYLDGQPVSTTPFQLSNITPGPHVVHVVLPGYRTWSMPVNVSAGSRGEIAASLEP